MGPLHVNLLVRAMLPLLVGSAAAYGAASLEAPSLAPQLGSIFPHGGRPGATLEVRIRGANLGQARRLEFARPGIQAEIVSSEFRLIRARIRIAANAEVGPHEFRLFTADGGAAGVFSVGTLPEIAETEPNNGPATAQRIEYPAMINGVADAADADFFAFRARPGQTLAFDIDAARSGSMLDPVLTILDSEGRQLAYCDDYYISKDAHLEHTFSRDGIYYVTVTASFERSAADAEYRLVVTDREYPMYAVPAGGQRGNAIEVTIHGTNLGAIDRAWVGPEPVKGSTVLSRSPSEVKLRVTVPNELAAGAHLLHLASADGETPHPIRFEVSDIPEVTVHDAEASSRAHPILVQAPVLVNGEIGEHGPDYLARQHWFEFEARAGARYEFLVRSWDLGLRLDPVVAVYDVSGKKLAFEDDPAPNSFIHYAASHDPRLVYRFAEAGRYRVCVRDAMYRGGAGYIYRLSIHETQPGFSADVHGPNVTAYIGRKTTILAQVHRTGGVHEIECFKHPGNEIENFRIREIDGWSTPVLLSIEGLPEGVSSETISAEPHNTVFKGNDGEELFVDGTLVELPVVVGARAEPGLYRLRVRAEGQFEGRTVRQHARVLHTTRGRRGQPVEGGVTTCRLCGRRI